MYEVHRARVDRAYERMQTISARPHAPADARRAAAELEAVLREATAVASEMLRQAQPRTETAGRWWHRRTSRATSPAVARWSRELVHLSEIAVWLRRTTLDDLGLHVPAATPVTAAPSTPTRAA